MGQNTSSAVMQQRASTAPDELDYFPTPPWAARALCEILPDYQAGVPRDHVTCWEPASGENHLVRGLVDYFGHVRSSDVFKYRPGQIVCDFLLDGRTMEPAEWIITNPPFVLGQEFVEMALRKSRVGCAMLVRSAFLEGDQRHRELFTAHPPAAVCQFVERVVMLKGRLIRDGAPDPFNLDAKGNPVKARSATAYSWIIWANGHTDTRFRWIPKCRARLERPGDYPAYAEKWAELTIAGASPAPQLDL